MNLKISVTDKILLFYKSQIIWNFKIQYPISCQWKELVLYLTDVIDLHIYKFKSNLNYLTLQSVSQLPCATIMNATLKSRVSLEPQK